MAAGRGHSSAHSGHKGERDRFLVRFSGWFFMLAGALVLIGIAALINLSPFGKTPVSATPPAVTLVQEGLSARVMADVHIDQCAHCAYYQSPSYTQTVRLTVRDPTRGSAHVVVCGALIVDSTNGAGQMPNNEAQDCREYFIGAHSVIHAVFHSYSKLQFKTNIYAADHGGLAEINGYPVKGANWACGTASNPNLEAPNVCF